VHKSTILDNCIVSEHCQDKETIVVGFDDQLSPTLLASDCCCACRSLRTCSWTVIFLLAGCQQALLLDLHDHIVYSQNSEAVETLFIMDNLVRVTLGQVDIYPRGTVDQFERHLLLWATLSLAQIESICERSRRKRLSGSLCFGRLYFPSGRGRH
jgi:hypothetical protein